MESHVSSWKQQRYGTGRWSHEGGGPDGFNPLVLDIMPSPNKSEEVIIISCTPPLHQPTIYDRR